MAIAINVLDHIALTVSDLERSLAFYCDLLGLREVSATASKAMIAKMMGKPDVVLQVVRLAAPDTPHILLDLQQYITPQGKASTAQLGDVAHTHFCYGVPDLLAAYQELQAKASSLSLRR